MIHDGEMDNQRLSVVARMVREWLLSCSQFLDGPVPGLGTRLCQGPDGINRPNDPAQPHLGAHTQALPISPQAMAVNTA